MQEKGWIIDDFDFVYKHFIRSLSDIVFKRQKIPQYALLKVGIIQIE